MDTFPACPADAPDREKPSLSGLLALSCDIALQLDDALHITHWVHSAGKAVPPDVEGRTGLSVSAVLPEHCRKPVVEFLNRLPRDASPDEMECRDACGNTWQLRAMRGPGGFLLVARNLGAVAAFCSGDVGKTAAQACAYQRLNAVVKHYPGMIWCLDDAFTLTLLEGTMLSELGIEPANCIGKSIFDLHHLFGQYADNFRKTLAEGSCTFEGSHDGRYYRCITTALHGADGCLSGQMGAALDITDTHNMQLELQSAMEEARKASSAKSEFLSRMSHEIRTPMNAILGMNEMARRSDDTARIHYCLDKIDHASRQLLELINDILDMSKIEANKLEITYGEFDFEAMLLEVCNVVEVRAQEKQQRFDIELDQMFTRHVVSDALRLTQILVNLLTNAIKFTPQKGRIVLRIRREQSDEDGAVLYAEVADTGIGIEPETQARLFRSFEQADGSISRRFGGTGLGLSICKSLIELMGGEIGVDSEPGKGSRFYFRIPVGWGSPLDQRTITSTLQTANVRVLVVMGDKEERRYVRDILTNFSMSCTVAANEAEALDAVRRACQLHLPYSAMLIDMQLPGHGGLILNRRIRELVGNSTPIVLFTANSREEQGVKGEVDDASAILSKPILPSMLLNTISAQMGCSIVRPAQGELPQTDWKGKRLLMAEDIEVNREILLGILEDSGIAIDCAENGQQALERYRDQPRAYDLILMDLQMPVMDGLEATRRIRESGLDNCQTIPIIAMTANAFQSDIDQCLAAGMNNHVAKPIDLEDLMAKLGMYL